VPSPLPELPEIPPEVYESRDRGDLVLFCGAGVSKNAGCPTFGELACMVEDEFGPFGEQEQEELSRKQFDVYMQLVEDRLDAGAADGHLRRFVRDRLRRSAKTTAVHESILKLARRSDGTSRLVTTNYDRHFQTAAKRLRIQLTTDAAPRIASPRLVGWNSLVHLHGALAGDDLRHLVLTSADFGRAYLTEGWAANFVTELLESFDVLFLGYSADDVVMKYVLGANAQHRASHGRHLWSLAAPRDGESLSKCTARWKQLGVTLIPYEARGKDHAQCATALSDWSSIIESRKTRRARLELILNEGTSQLTRCGRKSQLQWLLGDVTCDGVDSLYVERDGGRRPSYVEWLDEFAKLGLLEQRATRDATLAENRQIARSPLVGRFVDQLALGDRASAFAQWMTELALDGEARSDHRSNSEVLLKWVQSGDRGAALHPQLANQILRGLQQRGGTLPTELREAWTLVVDPGVNAALASTWSGDESWSIERDVEANPSVGVVAQRLLHAFTPFLKFTGSSAVEYRLGREAFLKLMAPAGTQSETLQLSRYHYADSTVVLRCDLGRPGIAQHLIETLERSTRRDALLREMGLGLNALLERALTLIQYTQADPERFQMSSYPFVGSGDEPDSTGGSTVLADLTAQAGLKLDEVDDRRAHALYRAWVAGPQLTQKRLALHATVNWENGTRATEGRIDADVLREWLSRSALESEVVAVLRRLARTSDLEPDLQARLAELERSSAAVATSAEADTGVEYLGPPVPVSPREIHVEELAELVASRADFTTPGGRTAGGLDVLVQQGKSRRLLEALDLALDAYEPRPTETITGAAELDPFPDRAARYLLAIAEHEKKSEQEREISTDELMPLWDKLEPIALAVERGGIDASSRQELTKAINHPAGELAQALFAILLPKSVQYRSWLDGRLKERVERNVTKPGAAGRAFLAIAASRLYPLYFAESKWAAEVLIPHFDWKDETRARTSWQGYLWGPQLNPSLFAQLHDAFFDTFERTDQLGEFAESLCGLLVSLALDGEGVLLLSDSRRALRTMSDDLRVTVVSLLCRRLENAQHRSAELARARVVPWLRTWPLDADIWRNEKLADEITELALACDDAVTEATSFIVEQPHLKLGRWPMALHAVLDEHADLFVQHSHDIARLFDHVLPSREENLRLGGQVWYPAQLQQLVDKLREAGEPVTSSPEFKRLEARL